MATFGELMASPGPIPGGPKRGKTVSDQAWEWGEGILMRVKLLVPSSVPEEATPAFGA